MEVAWKLEDIFLDFHDLGRCCRSQTFAQSILSHGYADSAGSIQCCTKIASHGTKDYTIRVNKHLVHANQYQRNLQVFKRSNLTHPDLIGRFIFCHE